jgi:hypothetical protein
MGHIQDLIKQQIPDIYTYSIEVGASVEDDVCNKKSNLILRRNTMDFL